MTPDRHGPAVIEFPNDLEILVIREFDAPIKLVFDVLTKPEHVRKTFAPYGEEIKECSIDLRVGGNYHLVFVTDDGTECSFRGTYLEIEPPTRIAQTWLFDGWPDAHAGSLEITARSPVSPLLVQISQACRREHKPSPARENTFGSNRAFR